MNSVQSRAPSSLQCTYVIMTIVTVRYPYILQCSFQARLARIMAAFRPCRLPHHRKAYWTLHRPSKCFDLGREHLCSERHRSRSLASCATPGSCCVPVSLSLLFENLRSTPCLRLWSSVQAPWLYKTSQAALLDTFRLLMHKKRALNHPFRL